MMHTSGTLSTSQCCENCMCPCPNVDHASGAATKGKEGHRNGNLRANSVGPSCTTVQLAYEISSKTCDMFTSFGFGLKLATQKT